MKKKKQNDFKKFLAEKIKKLRVSKNLSQTKLAEKLGVHYIHISRYERGISIPSVESLKNLSEVLGVSADYFLDDTNADFQAIKLKDKELMQMIKAIDDLDVETKKIAKDMLGLILYKHKVKSL